MTIPLCRNLMESSDHNSSHISASPNKAALVQCTYSQLLYTKLKNMVCDAGNANLISAGCDNSSGAEQRPQQPEQRFNDVLVWSVDDVSAWVSRIGFSKAAAGFAEAGVDGDLLLQLDEKNLRDDLGFANGIHRKRFLRELSALRKNADYSARDPSDLAGFLARKVGAEYRGYAYDLLRNDLGLELMRRASEHDLHDLLREAGVRSGIHRIRIIEAVAELGETKSSGGSNSGSNGSGNGNSNGNGNGNIGPSAMLATPAVSMSALSALSSLAPSPSPVDVYVTYPAGHAGAELASLLKMQLQLRGLSVYSASHPENALHYVRQARAFVVVLSGPGALDACLGDSEAKSGLHREVRTALRHDCNVVPVIDGGFQFPEADELPEDVRALASFNGVRWAHDYQDACVDKLERFLRGAGAGAVAARKDSGRSTPACLTPVVARKARSRTVSCDSAISSQSS